MSATVPPPLGEAGVGMDPAPTNATPGKSPDSQAKLEAASVLTSIHRSPSRPQATARSPLPRRVSSSSQQHQQQQQQQQQQLPPPSPFETFVMDFASSTAQTNAGNLSSLCNTPVPVASHAFSTPLPGDHVSLMSHPSRGAARNLTTEFRSHSHNNTATATGSPTAAGITTMARPSLLSRIQSADKAATASPTTTTTTTSKSAKPTPLAMAVTSTSSSSSSLLPPLPLPLPSSSSSKQLLPAMASSSSSAASTSVPVLDNNKPPVFNEGTEALSSSTIIPINPEEAAAAGLETIHLVDIVRSTPPDQARRSAIKRRVTIMGLKAGSEESASAGAATPAVSTPGSSARKRAPPPRPIITTSSIETPAMIEVLNSTANKCKCKRSHCLKLYCDCFSASMLCSGECTCVECCNNEGNEDKRQEAIQALLEKNPKAFTAKIKATADLSVFHAKGCRCKRSGCLKKYCECFAHGIKCSDQCQCTECQNGPNGLPVIPQPRIRRRTPKRTTPKRSGKKSKHGGDSFYDDDDDYEEGDEDDDVDEEEEEEEEEDENDEDIAAFADEATKAGANTLLGLDRGRGPHKNAIVAAMEKEAASALLSTSSGTPKSNNGFGPAATFPVRAHASSLSSSQDMMSQTALEAYSSSLRGRGALSQDAFDTGSRFSDMESNSQKTVNSSSQPAMVDDGPTNKRSKPSFPGEDEKIDTAAV